MNRRNNAVTMSMDQIIVKVKGINDLATAQASEERGSE